MKLHMSIYTYTGMAALMLVSSIQITCASSGRLESVCLSSIFANVIQRTQLQVLDKKESSLEKGMIAKGHNFNIEYRGNNIISPMDVAEFKGWGREGTIKHQENNIISPMDTPGFKRWDGEAEKQISRQDSGISNRRSNLIKSSRPKTVQIPTDLQNVQKQNQNSQSFTERSNADQSSFGLMQGSKMFITPPPKTIKEQAQVRINHIPGQESQKNDIAKTRKPLISAVEKILPVTESPAYQQGHPRDDRSLSQQKKQEKKKDEKEAQEDYKIEWKNLNTPSNWDRGQNSDMAKSGDGGRPIGNTTAIISTKLFQQQAVKEMVKNIIATQEQTRRFVEEYSARKKQVDEAQKRVDKINKRN